MYCIINQSNDIIAGDKEFFTLLNAESLMELYGQIANGDTSISFGSDNITITHLDDTKVYNVRMFELNGLLSQANIIEIITLTQSDTDMDNSRETLHLKEVKSLEHIEPALAEDEVIEYAKPATEEDSPLEHIEPTLTKDETIEQIKLTIEEDSPLEYIGLSIEENNLASSNNDDIDTPLEIIQDQTTSIDISIENDDEVLGLCDMTQDTHAQENKELTVDKPADAIEPLVQAFSIYIPPIENQSSIDMEHEEQENSFGDIEIDIPLASQETGLSQTEYASFLEEYIQTAQSLKADLIGNNEDKKQLAIKFIVHLSDVLCLPIDISDVVSTLSSTPTPEHIDRFYNTIAKIKAKNQPPETISFGDSSQGIAEEIEVKEIKIQSELAPKKVHSIDLSDIVPMKFDFILDEAVRELSLPSDIVKEFITYFIEQSHTEIETILDAYEEGDVEKVKRTAHLLKGVASNLYITPLAESLFDLQYNEDIKQVEPLVKKYWAQFISFENLMNSI